MTRVQRRAAAAILLTALLACSDQTGPSLDGEQYMSATVNDAPWELSSLGLSLDHDTLRFGGWHTAAGPQVYSLGLTITPFQGRAIYNLSGALANELYIDLQQPGWYTQSYVIDQHNPGTLTITDYRLSDSTFVGFFSAELEHIVVDSAPVPAHLSVHGSFRLRPGNTN